MARTKGSKDYSRELKLKAMKMYLEEGMTQRAIAEALGIRDRRQVKTWLHAYRQEGEQAFSKVRRGGPGRPRKPRPLASASIVNGSQVQYILVLFHVQ